MQKINLLVHALHKSKKSKPSLDTTPADQIAALPDNPDEFKLQLETPICDNTTQFSKFIHKRLPHLRDKIKQCSSHLKGIACKRNCITSI
jgi:hypothetical protein